MKKDNNNTWLGFFKKTLKISGFILVISIIGIGIFIYKGATYDSNTYISCKEDGNDKPAYYAFNEYRLLSGWDSLNEKFENNYKIIEFNKEIIKAVFYFAQTTNNTELKVYDKKPSNVISILEGYMSFNRETGKYNLSFEDRGMVGNEEDCIKINKSDLPVKELNQKF